MILKKLRSNDGVGGKKCYSLFRYYLVPSRNNSSSNSYQHQANIFSKKHIYCKLLVEFAISKMDSRKIATEIIKEVNILKAVDWLQTTSEQLSNQCIQNCFKKCGFKVPNPHISNLDDGINTKFEKAFNRFSGTCGLIVD